MAELSGADVVDGFINHIPDEDVLAAVINCGGTARIGVYPKKRIPTVDVFPGSPAGPLAQFITPDIFVSDVGPRQVSAATAETATAEPEKSVADTKTAAKEQAAAQYKPSGFTGIVVGFGNFIGYVINTLLSSGRQALDIMLKTVIPFMAYVALLIGFVNYSGVSDWLADLVTPLASNLPVQYALPTLFAINGQVGADFVPVGLSLGEAKPETISVGVPAVLFTRLVTSPIAVIIAFGFSFFM